MCGPLFVALPRPHGQGSLPFSRGQPQVTDRVNERTGTAPVVAMPDTANADENPSHLTPLQNDDCFAVVATPPVKMYSLTSPSGRVIPISTDLQVSDGRSQTAPESVALPWHKRPARTGAPAPTIMSYPRRETLARHNIHRLTANAVPTDHRRCDRLTLRLATFDGQITVINLRIVGHKQSRAGKTL
jgi:hypothetical protein